MIVNIPLRKSIVANAAFVVVVVVDDDDDADVGDGGCKTAGLIFIDVVWPIGFQLFIAFAWIN